MNMNYEKLETEDFKQKYSSLYDGLRTSSKISIQYHTLFFARRIILSLSAIFLIEYPFLQIQLHLLTSLASLMFIGFVKPFKNPSDNCKELFNEICIILVSYSLI